jgi:hypothetical protein
MRRCVNCGKDLPGGSRTDRRTCSPRCRVALSRRLSKGGAVNNAEWTDPAFSGVNYRICGELYGAEDATSYREVMDAARVCRHPATYRIVIPGLGELRRCGRHAAWYRKPGNRVVPVTGSGEVMG